MNHKGEKIQIGKYGKAKVDRMLEINRLLDPDGPIRPYDDPFGPQGHKIVKLTDKHHRVLRMVVLGYDNQTIADSVGVTERTIRTVKASPIAQLQMKFLRGANDKKTYDIAQMIKECLPRCVEVLKEQLEDDEVHASLKSKNALALLAIGGHGQTSKQAVVHAHLTGDRIESIKQRAIESGLMKGSAGEDDIIDI